MRPTELTLDLVSTAKDYAIKCHSKVNQTYDGHPYEFHLQMVNDVYHMFKYLTPEEDQPIVEAALWLHDVIEDTGVTYNDVAKVTNHRVANIVYALTNNKGKNRKQRANKNYYRGIRVVKYARFAKMCDRLANIMHSSNTNSSMLKVYRNEQANFVKELYSLDYFFIFETIHNHLCIDGKFAYRLSTSNEINRMIDKPVLYLIEKLSSL
jgi:(p)ppGpp synthase/HD superfamily hydrolase